MVCYLIYVIYNVIYYLKAGLQKEKRREEMVCKLNMYPKTGRHGGQLSRYDEELRDFGPRDAPHNGPSGRASVLKAPALWILICG